MAPSDQRVSWGKRDIARGAHGLRLTAVQACKTGAEQGSVVLGDHGVGERIGLAEQAMGLAACGLDALLRLAFALQRADLNNPAGMNDGRLGRAVLRGSLR